MRIAITNRETLSIENMQGIEHVKLRKHSAIVTKINLENLQVRHLIFNVMELV